jgi:hypothetical protein
MKILIRLFAGLFLAGIMGPLHSQDYNFPDLPGYRLNTDFPVFLPDNLWDFINGAAENYLTYGFKDLHVAEYKKGKNVIKLEIYNHGDPTLAFGIYSTERSPTFKFIDLGAQGYITGGAINFFKGNYYVKIRTYSSKEKTIQSALDLARRVAVNIEGRAGMPPELSLFPAEGRKQNEEMYINQSVLGHKFLNMAFKANYEVGPDNFSVFIFNFKTADEAWQSAEAYLASCQVDALESSSGKYMLSDGYNGTIFIAWKDNKMVVISGLAKDQSDMADKYTSAILK